MLYINNNKWSCALH